MWYALFEENNIGFLYITDSELTFRLLNDCCEINENRELFIYSSFVTIKNCKKTFFVWFINVWSLEVQ